MSWIVGVFKWVFLVVLVTVVFWSWVGFVSELKGDGFDAWVDQTQAEEVSMQFLSGVGTVEDEEIGTDGFDGQVTFESIFEGLEGFIPGG